MPRQHTSIREQRQSLPIYPFRDELVDAIKNNNILVVIGETGSGKTTQIPQYILEDFVQEGKIGVTQPRRIAAITVAKRVAEEHGTPLGTTIGYTIRFDDRTNATTKLKYMTDGVLLREATLDPRLSQYSVLIVDEAHERTLETDVLFGLLQRTYRLRPHDLRVLVMSATLNVEKFSDFFGGCPIFSIPGRTYPVTIVHHQEARLASLRSTYVAKAVETALHVHKTEMEGDVLVFLTGQGEIERACKEFREKAALLDYRRDVKYHDSGKGVCDVVVFPIYASLETFEQKAIFEEPEEGVRKIVFSTNIAQTSVTIPGIRYVIDSGFVKEKSFDPNTGMDALLVTEISQAAATQRAGRAGRTMSGKCYRLYNRASFDSLASETVPEIQRSSLLGTALSLKKMGIVDILRFDFIDPPDSQLVQDALCQLYLLGAIDQRGLITPLGDLMSRFPLSPFLSRALVAAARDYGCSDEVLTIASVMSVEEVFVIPSGRNEKRQHDADEARKQFADPTGDHMTLLNVYETWRRVGDGEEGRTWCREQYLNWRNLDMVRNVRQQLMEVMEKSGLRIVKASRVEIKEKGRKKGTSSRSGSSGGSRKRTAIDPAPILKSFLTAYYIHLAKRHANRSLFYHYSIISHHSDAAEDTATASASRDSNSSLLALHVSPQSALADDEAAVSRQRDDLDWVMYTHVTYTTRAIMRVVSKVLWEWVGEVGGLERAKGLGRAALSGVKEGEEEEDNMEVEMEIEAKEFRLLETILYVPDTGFYLLDRHITRILASAEFFKQKTAGRLFSTMADLQELTKALEASVPKDDGRKRVRLLVDTKGKITVEHTPLPTPDVTIDAQPPAPLPIVLDMQPTPTSVSPWVRHKTTRRDVYDSARERTGCDYGGGGPGKEGVPFDVVLWNERREVTETSIANLAVEVKAEGEEESVWKTPLVEC
ncbi:hypothetical protein BC937DRAFT_88422, partial [Endogone sp. FLAS-F59071]